MATYDFDQNGIRQLGGFIREQMEDQGITIESLVQRCAEVGYTTNAPKIIRLRNGVGLEPPVGLLWAIARVGFIQHDDGAPFSLEDFLMIACGQVSPKSRPVAAEANGLYEVPGHPFPGAVRELRRLIGARSIAEAAKDWDLSPERLEELLTTTDSNRAIPSLVEAHGIIKKSYPDKLGNRLYQFYKEPSGNGAQRR